MKPPSDCEDIEDPLLCLRRHMFVDAAHPPHLLPQPGSATNFRDLAVGQPGAASVASFVEGEAGQDRRDVLTSPPILGDAVPRRTPEALPEVATP